MDDKVPVPLAVPCKTKWDTVNIEEGRSAMLGDGHFLFLVLSNELNGPNANSLGCKKQEVALTQLISLTDISSSKVIQSNGNELHTFAIVLRFDVLPNPATVTFPLYDQRASRTFGLISLRSFASSL